jgi:Flp pilus assembly protein TadD
MTSSPLLNDRDALAAAYHLLREGQLDKAEAVCRDLVSRAPHDAAAVHLLGLIRKQAGDAGQAELLLRKSIGLDSRNAEFRANLAGFLRGQGRLQDAEQEYRAALASSPEFKAARVGLARTLNDLKRHGEAEAQSRILVDSDARDPIAWSSLAMALRDQNRLHEAEAAYRRAVDVAPQYAPAHHNLGSVLSRLDRAEEALASLDRAEALGVRGFELLFNRGRALLSMYRIDEAEAAFEKAIAFSPEHAEAHINLARIRYMRGDANFARSIERAVAQSGGNSGLRLLHALIMRRSGALTAAESILRDVLQQEDLPDARSALAEVLHEGGRLEEAETHMLQAAGEKPNDPKFLENLVVILLARGRPQDAVSFIQAQRARAPHDQGWLAYEATAARLLGHPRYQELYDYARFVRVYDLEPPQGWSSMHELNVALSTALAERHPFKNHPLDQSLRHGSQTARSLLTDADVAIQAILLAFKDPIEDYRAAMGMDPRHPLTKRNVGPATYTGAWSVQLRREGFHVNHFHPQGWISSAYYVATPPEVEDVSLKSGWIKFGETRFPVPGATPELFVQPRPGRLVLFPSYMWHGTNPIHGDVPRLTIAFDVAPSNTPSE